MLRSERLHRDILQALRDGMSEEAFRPVWELWVSARNFEETVLRLEVSLAHYIAASNRGDETAPELYTRYLDARERMEYWLPLLPPPTLF